MDTNNFFSFSRIAMVMKREIMENLENESLSFDRNLCCIRLGNDTSYVDNEFW